MRRLDKIKPTGRGLAAALPEKVGGGAVYYPINANVYTMYEEFIGTAIDTDDWTDDSTLGTGGAAAITFASSLAVLDCSTGTGGTVINRLRSAITSSAHLYNVPFRATFWARISTTAGAGIAPTGLLGGVDSTSSPLAATLGVQSTDDTHVAKFFLDLSTAGGSSLANPVVNCLTRCGSTAAAFINSAAHTWFNSAVVGGARTATSFTGYVIEVTHRGVSFGIMDDKHSVQAPHLLSYFGSQVPRLDQNYYLDMRLTANGTAGYTQTDGVQLEIDTVIVEQLAPVVRPMQMEAEGIAGIGSIKSFLDIQAEPSSGSLVTSGSGLFLGCGISSSASAGADLFLGVFDASAAGSAVYDFSAGPSTGAKLIWYQQVNSVNSAGADVANFSTVSPPRPIPFYRGLVVGSVTIAATAIGNSALNVLTVFQSQK